MRRVRNQYAYIHATMIHQFWLVSRSEYQGNLPRSQRRLISCIQESFSKFYNKLSFNHLELCLIHWHLVFGQQSDKYRNRGGFCKPIFPHQALVMNKFATSFHYDSYLLPMHARGPPKNAMNASRFQFGSKNRAGTKSVGLSQYLGL